DRIPRVQEMDEKLQRLGWGAVAVEGFIPSPAFLEFQARGILPIAVDMRTVNHIAYTPAPDIVHEAAGHAPIIADAEYAAYLRQYARMAQKAILSHEDIELYEAIRTLSDVKENPDVSRDVVDDADEKFKKVSKSIAAVSEAGQMARMAWWTVEYGLVGDPKNPRIYGAGLLSSVGESQHCLSAAVKKIPLTVACVEQSYDITEPQPQLFVARDLRHLVTVLGEFEKTLAYIRGGAESVEKARAARTVNTVVLNGTVEASGIVESLEARGADVEFFKMRGPVQLAAGERELPGQGRGRHAQGFSTPVGRWKAYADRDPQTLSDSDLERTGMGKGKRARLEFVNGFVIEGQVRSWLRGGSQRLALMTFSDCRVSRGGKTYFDPEWGEFDLLVGDKVTSVYSGPADREAYGEFEMGEASTKPGRTSPYTVDERRVFALHGRTQALRAGSPAPAAAESEMREVLKTLVSDHPDEWLVAIELIELCHRVLKKDPQSLPWMAPAFALLSERKHDPAIQEMIQKGIGLAATA
ncbi:MAG TPA: aromatic amino acid hydroxylase, partial [Bdellovibrionota bacterium]|nr:aromatic amino acid hydroxylase [Bdellovibrionota bacterium]